MSTADQKSITIGFARLSDSVIIAAAKDRDLFAKYGLNVTLRRYDSWAAMRDALGHGHIDAAHLLAPMVVASAAGVGPFAHAFATAFAINLNGNAITVSSAVHQRIVQTAPETLMQSPVTADALKPQIAQRAQAGEPPLTLAHVFPHSMHAYEMRYWLAAGGVHPDRDVRLVVVPPSRMVESLRTGDIDGCCVGEPWNAAATAAGLGQTLITSAEIWAGSPEKVVAVRRDWAEHNHDTHVKLVTALLEAAAWVDPPAHRSAAAQLVSGEDYAGVPFEQVAAGLTGRNVRTGAGRLTTMPDFVVFHRYAANFPWASHAKWILSQMIRWADAPALAAQNADAIAKQAYLGGVYREAAQALGIAFPHQDEKIEGAHDHSWVLTDASAPIAFGPDRFFDGGRAFDPQAMEQYIAGFDVRAEHTLAAE